MSADRNWLVKLKRYGGGESVISSKMSKESAQLMADSYNLDNQTDACYIEEYDKDKVEWPSQEDYLSLIDSME